MDNFLLTFSTSQDEGFKNLYYLLDDVLIDIKDIEKYSDALVLIPYDYKNEIEPKCFQKKTDYQHPIILSVKEKKELSCIEDIEEISFNQYNCHKYKYLDKTIHQKVSYEEYLKNFQKIQKYLKSGDIYEMNYCIPFIYKNIDLPVHLLFTDLLKKMQSPFSALLKYEDLFILSFSPERFLKKHGDTLYTEPIKGTAARGKTIEEDEKNKTELQNSLKEKTENAMIVDVCRNDLSKIAQKGSVKVEYLYKIKTYATVHQMVSKISCQIKNTVSFKDIIHATFPMASMTGAPKIRAMQIADDVEVFSREFYSGCLGVYENGDFDLSVLIRSIFYDHRKKELKIWAGSAITIYANPYKEYQECILKAKKIIETIEKYLSYSNTMT